MRMVLYGKVYVSKSSKQDNLFMIHGLLKTIRQYFGFSRAETHGVLVLLLVTVVAISAVYLVQ